MAVKNGGKRKNNVRTTLLNRWNMVNTCGAKATVPEEGKTKNR